MMNEAIGWNHPIDKSDQWDGFNDSGIETFSGNPITNLAREINQNSLDSAATSPVRVKFHQCTVETSEIPNVDQLRETIKLCQAASINESPKARQFFERAELLLSKPEISILQVSDFNTTGMRGPSRNGTPFYAFTKAPGQSKKPDPTATGSFGIGKNAPYAVSALRTVFVSTVYRAESCELKRLTQGKAILMSHDDDEGNRRQGKGFWGVMERCQPVLGGDSNLPGWLLRGGSELTDQDIGTTITILGFDADKGWEEKIGASVGENFFGSIASKRLEVDIQNKKFLLVSSDIAGFFADEALFEAIKDEKNEPEKFKNAQNYLQCRVSSDGVITEESQTQHLGLCQLKIIIGENLPKRVCVLRNGMFISDALSLPGLKNFSDFKEFVAVFECMDPVGIELLRAMEPPGHDDFQPERLATREEQQKGKKALKAMAAWIREMLKRHAKDPISDVTTLDELKDFFPDDSGEGNGKAAEEVNPFGAVVIRARPVPVKLDRPASTPVGQGPGSDEDDGDGGGGADGAGGGDSQGAGKGSAPGGQGSATSRPGVALANLRAVNKSSKSRRIAFTPIYSGLIKISLFEAGADKDYELPIKEATAGEIKNGKLVLEVNRGGRVMFDIVFKSAFDGALKVVAHEV
jgi:hypothetical protein